ncbi:hypothetical protein EW146_g5232 [Bondarzewia mesenterica]|uniref:Piwi domain-containing protein n=1 Tax=Bondarzewia mesenterica TaxID=1095465 RepID=A0A4S4LXX4_9AGAM|nr:hypothetical protein EW146_g5232 [Bondarzewia mesenterica]
MPPRPALGYGARGGRPGGGPATRAPAVAAHVESVGVKRPNFGNSGRHIEVFTNHFAVSIPEEVIHHYDVISKDEQKLPAALNFELIRRLQTEIHPQLFTPRGVYDGRKNFFTARKLNFGDSAEFDVTLADQSQAVQEGKRSPKVYKIRLTHVAEINPEVLARFLVGKQSHDNTVLTAITALNVVVRMEPNLHYPFNVRSFFTSQETLDIGLGIVLWRGYFQSVRPAVGRMLINVDISTGAMYKSGNLLGLAMEFLRRRDEPGVLNSKMDPRERIRLQRFFTGVKIRTTYSKSEGKAFSPRVLRKLTKLGANELTFQIADGNTQSVADYFAKTVNRPLRWPSVICAEFNSGLYLPLEVCEVPPGQIIRQQLPSEKTSEILSFSTKQPADRLQSIRNGLKVLAYGQSEYTNHFGMKVSQDILKVKARVLQPPTLKYGAKSRQTTIVPKDGAWNMIDKQVYKPGGTIEQWCVSVFERKNRFGDAAAQDMINGLTAACKTVGIVVKNPPAIVRWHNAQASVDSQLRVMGKECYDMTRAPPTLIVVVLPEGANDVYYAVKHFGDIKLGVVTQCMKSMKCFRAKPQYYANVTLKMNVKLGGINTIPDPRSVSILTDPHNPTIVMGADVVHPAPGTINRPSFTALVANVDSDTAKYVATTNVQTSRNEIIEHLQSMSKHALEMYMGYRSQTEKKANPAPKRIIFYRDGVSEGQFKHVLTQELPLIQNACKELKINPKITMIVVGKRHHVRFFPKPGEGDRSGNCPAGTVIDSDIVNPIEFDFYLQSHGGLLGTSRPSHYNVLYDENGFTPDGIQSLSFALCHVYARSTRSVSIPAPVYYADIVCSRARHHYDPDEHLDISIDEGMQDRSAANKEEEARVVLEKFRTAFRPLNRLQQKLMYFC